MGLFDFLSNNQLKETLSSTCFHRAGLGNAGKDGRHGREV